MVAPVIDIDGDRLKVHFDAFDLAAYDLFLRAKQLPEWTIDFDPERETYTIGAPARGAEHRGEAAPAPHAGDLPLSPFLFDDQEEIVPMALAAKRFACWSDCGLGKTLVGLEWARHVLHRTGGRVLVFTLNEIVGQWLEEARRFYGDRLSVCRLESRAAMKEWAAHGPPGVAVTNYEKLNYAHEGKEGQVVREFQGLAGVILDEGSRLKTAGGKQKWALIKSCEQTEYKLVLTATPAPNDVFEFASQAGFLNKFRAEESINQYFRRDEKTHRWTVKPYARAAFFRFMASWSIYVREPRRYGWRLGLPEVPAPTVTVHEIPATPEQLDHLQRLSAEPSGQMLLPGMQAERETNAIQRAALSQVAKGFRYKKGGSGAFDRVPSAKPAFVADLVAREASAGAQVLVWTVFDAESTLLAEELRARGVAFELLTGKTRPADRLATLDRFRGGACRVLVSRPAVLGYGMNFQFCSAMVFSGWTDSYESYYQALRRAYRHGQTESLRVHLPVVPELESDMLDNIFRKQADHEAAIAEMERNYVKARRELRGEAA